MAREEALLEDALARLRAANCFDAVHDGPPWTSTAIDLGRMEAWIELADWNEENRSVETVIRTATVNVWVSARASDRTTCRRRMNRGVAAACKAINGQSLASISIPFLTKLDKGSDLFDMDGPTLSQQLTGQVAYRVAGLGANDDADTT